MLRGFASSHLPTSLMETRPGLSCVHWAARDVRKQAEDQGNAAQLYLRRCQEGSMPAVLGPKVQISFRSRPGSAPPHLQAWSSSQAGEYDHGHLRR